MPSPISVVIPDMTDKAIKLRIKTEACRQLPDFEIPMARAGRRLGRARKAGRTKRGEAWASRLASALGKIP
jgi:hypothetical protein